MELCTRLCALPGQPACPAQPQPRVPTAGRAQPGDSGLMPQTCGKNFGGSEL